MNKAEFVAAVARHSGLSQKDAKAAVDAIFRVDHGIIASELKAGRRVQITGFGTFEARRREARRGRNPQTGASIKIGAATYPAFKAGRSLKDKVRG